MTDRKAYPRVRKATERLTNRRYDQIKVPDSYAPFAHNVDAYMFAFNRIRATGQQAVHSLAQIISVMLDSALTRPCISVSPLILLRGI
jgi:hypothetical protein